MEVFFGKTMVCLKGKFIIKAYDWNKYSSNDLVGVASFNATKIKENHYGKYFWLNFYDCQRD